MISNREIALSEQWFEAPEFHDDLLLIEKEYVSTKKTIWNTKNEYNSDEGLKKPPFQEWIYNSRYISICVANYM